MNNTIMKELKIGIACILLVAVFCLLGTQLVIWMAENHLIKDWMVAFGFLGFIAIAGAGH